MVENFVPAEIARAQLNSFHYLYQDAEWFRAMVPAQSKSFDEVQICRTSVLLFVFSLEALINRAIAEFVPDPVRTFLLDREESYSLQDKWLLLPMLARGDKPETFDKGQYPFSHFCELVVLRNDFVHPKSDRTAFYRVLSNQSVEPLDFNRIPKGSGIREKDIVYRQTRLPRDPYSLQAEHVDRVKKIVDDLIAELDRLLGGRLQKADWLHNETWNAAYPIGSAFVPRQGGPAGGAA
jgi:hypothetical protein